MFDGLYSMFPFVFLMVSGGRGEDLKIHTRGIPRATRNCKELRPLRKEIWGWRLGSDQNWGWEGVPCPILLCKLLRMFARYTPQVT